jgi:hypothetical protein
MCDEQFQRGFLAQPGVGESQPWDCGNNHVLLNPFRVRCVCHGTRGRRVAAPTPGCKMEPLRGRGGEAMTSRWSHRVTIRRCGDVGGAGGWVGDVKTSRGYHPVVVRGRGDGKEDERFVCEHWAVWVASTPAFRLRSSPILQPGVDAVRRLPRVRCIKNSTLKGSNNGQSR